MLLRSLIMNSPRLSYVLLVSTILLSGCTDSLSMDQGFRQANKGFLSAAFSSDGSIEFISSFNHGGSLWQTVDGERLYDWNHKSNSYSAIRAAVFSEDNKFVATAEDDTVVLWNVSNGESIRYWHSPTRILSIDIAKQYVLLGQDDDTARLINIVAGGIVRELNHEGAVSSVSLSVDAEYALTGSHDGSARYWSLATGEELYRKQYDQPIDFVLLSNDGRLALSAAYQGKVSIWSTADGKEILSLYRRNPGITSARFKANLTELLVGTSRETIILWDLATGREKEKWRVPNDGPWHKAAILSVSFNESQLGFLAAASNGFSYRFD